MGTAQRDAEFERRRFPHWNRPSMAQLANPLRRGAACITAAGLNLLFPPRCACCEADLPAHHDDLLLCEDCRVLLGPKLWPCCPRCGAAGIPPGGPGGCRSCRKTPLKFDAAIPLGSYNDQLRRVVLRMKRPSHDSLSVAIGRLLVLRRGQQLAELRTNLVVPIPMYWARRLKRGTNSAEILAEAVGRSLGVPVGRRVLSRCRNTLSQDGLSPVQRFRNVRGAFRVRGGRHLEGIRVLLVDDILTTGATCSEAAATLKRAGAAAVAATVVARAEGPNQT
jgi:ComF family protein